MKRVSSIILKAAAILVIGLTATTMHPTQVQASIPDPGQCTYKATNFSSASVKTASLIIPVLAVLSGATQYANSQLQQTTTDSYNMGWTDGRCRLVSVLDAIDHRFMFSKP
jgi:hypothetical protein